jgi:hypothetical protein
MTAAAAIGNELRFKYLNTAVSPNAYTTLDAVIDFGEFGETKPLIDITAQTSTGREYRNGLSDGIEIPLSMNFHGNTANVTSFNTLFTAYTNNTTLGFQISVLNASPQFGFRFNGTVNSWRLSGQIGEKATATFSIKISGAVSKGAYA